MPFLLRSCRCARGLYLIQLQDRLKHTISKERLVVPCSSALPTCHPQSWAGRVLASCACGASQALRLSRRMIRGGVERCLQSSTRTLRDVAFMSDHQENDRIIIKEMTLDDLRTGWNPGDGDAEVFFNADENGFFMAKSERGDPVVSIAAVRYGEDYGILGMYICVPEQHGKGYGKSTFGHAIRHLEGRVIELDAVIEQGSNYAKWSFSIAHEIISFAGAFDLEALPPVPISTGDVCNHVVVEDLGQGRIDALLEFDEKHVPAARERFLRGWLTTPGHVIPIAIVGEEIKGYGVLRPCSEIPRIGPLFAESTEVVGLLIRALVAGSSGGTKVSIDVLAPNQVSIELVGRLGLTETWKSFRMYRGPVPELPLERIYGMTCLQLG